MSGSLPENVNFGIKVETVRSFVKANNIRTNSWGFSSGKTLTSVEIAEIALNTTIHLQCWNTLAALREMSKTNKVRNLLIDID